MILTVKSKKKKIKKYNLQKKVHQNKIKLL
jgi:hypothetical protein